MRTVTFTSVLAGVASVLGIEPAAYTAALQAKALLAINRHIKTGWKFDFWPELTLVEQRAYRPFWDEVTQFDAGAQVYFADDGLYYQANTAPNNPQDGESPAAYPAKWTAVTDFRRYIALDQPGKTPIDEVEGLYSYDPRLRTERPARLPFTLSHEGVVPMAETYALVWIKFRMRVSQFTQTVFDPASAYAAGALVLSSAGEGYRAITAVPTGSELTDPIYWEAQPFPAFLDDFVIHAAAADLLAGEGQTRAAAAERALADTYLAGAFDEQFPGQAQYTTAQARTY